MMKRMFLWGSIVVSSTAFSQDDAYRSPPASNAELVQQQINLEERQLDMEQRLRYLEETLLKQGNRAEKLKSDGNPANHVGPLDIEVTKKDKVSAQPMSPMPYPNYRMGP